MGLGGSRTNLYKRLGSKVLKWDAHYRSVPRTVRAWEDSNPRPSALLLERHRRLTEAKTTALAFAALSRLSYRPKKILEFGFASHENFILKEWYLNTLWQIIKNFEKWSEAELFKSYL